MSLKANSAFRFHHESPFSPRNCTSLQDPIFSQELYFPKKKWRLENMQDPILSQELYFSKKKFRLENVQDPILSRNWTNR
jgi:hypothetical protein